MKTKRWFCLLALIYASLNAQQTIHDGMLWTGIRLKANWSQQWKSHLHAEYRWAENMGQAQKWYLQSGSSFRPIEGLQFNLVYRFENRYRPNQQMFHPRHRVQAGLTLSRKWKRFELALRSHGQIRYNTRPGADEPWRFHVREKLSIEYKWPNLPLATAWGYEAWIPLDGRTETPISRHRFFMDMEVKFAKNQKITIGILYNFNTALGGKYRDIGLKVRHAFTWKPRPKR